MESLNHGSLGRGQKYLIVLLVACWILAGLFGHEPWRQDEAYTFGMLVHIIETGDWVVPTLAGEPFMEKPPFFFYTAVLFGKLFSPPLTLPDAVRLSAGFFTALSALFLFLAARRWFGSARAWFAPLALISSPLLAKYAHLTITDNALLSAFCLMLYSWSLFPAKPLWAGVAGGTAIGMGLMTKGLIGPGIMAVTTLLLPGLFRSWRGKQIWAYMLVVACAALPWLLIWPVALYLRSPELFMQWFWDNNFGRFFGTHYDPRKTWFQFNYLEFIFLLGAPPTSYFAAWGLWKDRRELRGFVGWGIPLLCFGVCLLVLGTASNMRDLYGLPMLAPLSISAVLAGAHISEKWAKGLNRFFSGFFGLAGFAIWLGWFVMVTGWPAMLAQRFYDPAPEYVPGVMAVALTGGILVSLLWFAVQRLFDQRIGRNVLLHWAAGLTLCWGLLNTLWMPWTDAWRNYRYMLMDLKPHLPEAGMPIERVRIGEPLRALFHYYAGVQTTDAGSPTNATASWLLMEYKEEKDASELGDSWDLVWEGRHTENRREVYRLYKRVVE